MATEYDILKSLSTTNIPLYNNLGFVELVDMVPRILPIGRTADVAVSRNARVSYAALDKSVAEDNALVQYLMENRHTSPFESVSFTFRIRCPIFVERQLVRHRTASINEQSFRYTVPQDDFYYPEMRMQSDVNKQGSSSATVSDDIKKEWKYMQQETLDKFKKYNWLVELGCAREVARCDLPVSIMTSLMWTMDLHNLMHFLSLRKHPHAQLEIHDLADAIYCIIQPAVPVSIEAFDNFRLNGMQLSRDEQNWIRSLANTDATDLKISKRKLENFVNKLHKLGLEDLAKKITTK